MIRKNLKLAVLTALAAVLLVPASAFAHATISGLQGSTYKTSARTSYLIRVPNEKAAQNTIRLDVFVPDAVQTAISVKKVPGWKIKLYTTPSGQTTEGGEPINKITRISYFATPDAEILPHFFEEFPVRFQNPATAQTMCFPMVQMYRGANGRGVERVFWTGASNSATPASCLNVVA